MPDSSLSQNGQFAQGLPGDWMTVSYGALTYALLDNARARSEHTLPQAGMSEAPTAPVSATVTGTVDIDGLSIAIHANYSENVTRALRRGRYEHTERRAAKIMLGRGDRVLELGGAIGVVAMTCATVVGAENVVSIEANPDLIGHARYNFDKNGHSVAVKNAILRSAADWAGEGERADFHIAEDFWSSSLTKRGRILRTVAIPVLCLEKEIEAARANVLVCDIEGGEVELLQKADLSRIDKIIMEIHYWATGVAAANQLVAKLLQSGFEIDWVLSGSSLVCLYRGRASWWKQWDRDDC